MWYAVVLRFIRKRLVLAAIFCFSLTYCLVNLLGNGTTLNLDNDSDFEIKREQPIIWQIDTNTTANDPSTVCRNSIQGKILIVDDHGFVCQRSDVLTSGCCNIDISTTNQYTCDTCNSNGCCSIYEHCVSCCLHPNKKSLLEQIIEKATGHQLAVFASVKDQFELCLSKCRTDSHSVQHENKYRDPKSKYCYGLTKAHESQTDSSGKNNIVK